MPKKKANAPEISKIIITLGITTGEACERMEKFDPCFDARRWLAERMSEPWQKTWEGCERGDWMLWLLAKAGVDRKLVVRAACACARESLKYIPKGEDRPRLCIEVTERWTRGEATIKEVLQARYSAAAAYAAAYAAYAAACAASAAAAADAADAAYAAADAADCAADAAADADCGADAAAARNKARKRAAEIVRSFFPEVPNV